MIGGFTHDFRASLACLLAVKVHVLHAHEHRVCRVALFRESSRQDHCAVPNVHLGAMIANTNSQSKTERAAKPLDRFADVRVCEFRNYCAPRDGTINQHMSWF